MDTLLFDLSFVSSFVNQDPEVHEFHTIIAPDGALFGEWGVFPSAKRLLLTDDMSDKRN